jgi:TonB family protein
VSSSVYDKDGLKFNYPSDWTLADRSSPETQHLLLSKPGTLLLIVIASPRDTLSNSEQFWTMRHTLDQRFFAAIEKGLTGTGEPGVPENPCLDFNGRNIAGKRFKGTYRDQPSIGEVFPFALSNRLLTLIYLRAEKDIAIGDQAWKEVIGSMYLNGSHRDAVGLKFKYDVVDQGPLNGRAIKLEKPGYPVAAGRINGIIRVNIVVDEEGNVVAAAAGPGNQYFRAYAVDAAKRSKFRPTTVCGKGVSVTGVITYEFKVDSPCEIGVPRLRC